MKTTYNPDSEPFELKLSNLPPTAPVHQRAALVMVNDNIDFAKRMLLQNRVRDFTASDVIEVAKMILRLQTATVSGEGDDE
jgi:hypothetical protein